MLSRAKFYYLRLPMMCATFVALTVCRMATNLAALLTTVSTVDEIRRVTRALPSWHGEGAFLPAASLHYAAILPTSLPP